MVIASTNPVIAIVEANFIKVHKLADKTTTYNVLGSATYRRRTVYWNKYNEKIKVKNWQPSALKKGRKCVTVLHTPPSK